MKLKKRLAMVTFMIVCLSLLLCTTAFAWATGFEEKEVAINGSAIVNSAFTPLKSVKDGVRQATMKAENTAAGTSLIYNAQGRTSATGTIYTLQTATIAGGKNLNMVSATGFTNGYFYRVQLVPSGKVTGKGFVRVPV